MSMSVLMAGLTPPGHPEYMLYTMRPAVLGSRSIMTVLGLAVVSAFQSGTREAEQLARSTKCRPDDWRNKWRSPRSLREEPWLHILP